MRTLRLACYAGILFASIASTTSAQVADSAHRHAQVKVKLFGLVTNESNAPVSGAQVNVLDSGKIGRGVTTGADGWFELKDLDEGFVSIIVRRLGYQPRTMTLDVHQGAEEFVPIALAQATTRLDTVIVSERRISGRLAAFEERRRKGLGHFIDSTIFQKSAGGRVSNVLLRVPGIKVIPPPPNARMRAGAFSRGYRVRMRGDYLGDCVPALFVDGMRIIGTEIDEYITPESVAAVEVYSVAMMPPEFMGSNSACGAIVVWLK